MRDQTVSGLNIPQIFRWRNNLPLETSLELAQSYFDPASRLRHGPSRHFWNRKGAIVAKRTEGMFVDFTETLCANRRLNDTIAPFVFSKVPFTSAEAKAARQLIVAVTAPCPETGFASNPAVPLIPFSQIAGSSRQHGALALGRTGLQLALRDSNNNIKLHSLRTSDWAHIARTGCKNSTIFESLRTAGKIFAIMTHAYTYVWDVMYLESIDPMTLTAKDPLRFSKANKPRARWHSKKALEKAFQKTLEYALLTPRIKVTVPTEPLRTRKC